MYVHPACRVRLSGRRHGMTYWTAILLGIIQGLAEFLPISSSGLRPQGLRDGPPADGQLLQCAVQADDHAVLV